MIITIYLIHTVISENSYQARFI